MAWRGHLPRRDPLDERATLASLVLLAAAVPVGLSSGLGSLLCSGSGYAKGPGASSHMAEALPHVGRLRWNRCALTRCPASLRPLQESQNTVERHYLP